MIRRYLAPIAGDGLLAPFRPVILNGLRPRRWTAIDTRANSTLLAGYLLVELDVSDAEHATVIALVDVTELRAHRADGTAVESHLPVSYVEPTRLTETRERLEATGYDLSVVPAGVTVRQFFATLEPQRPTGKEETTSR